MWVCHLLSMKTWLVKFPLDKVKVRTRFIVGRCTIGKWNSLMWQSYCCVCMIVSFMQTISTSYQFENIIFTCFCIDTSLQNFRVVRNFCCVPYIIDVTHRLRYGDRLPYLRYEFISDWAGILGYIDSDVSHRFPWLLYSVLSIYVCVRRPSVINKPFYSIVSEFFLTLLL